MDWSSVYEAHGDEEGIWSEPETSTTSVRAGMLHHLSTYNTYVAYAFTVNYILGVGCLGVPYAVYESGLLLGTFIIVFLSFISYVTVMWVAETSYRGVQVRIERTGRNPFQTSSFSTPRKKAADERSRTPRTVFWSDDKAATGEGEAADETTALAVNESESTAGKLYSSISKYFPIRSLSFARVGSQDENDDPRDHLELEVTDLASEFLGPLGKLCYQGSLMMLTYAGLLAYSQVFNSSFLDQVWSTKHEYIPVVIFGAIVIPLSCFNLEEQITTQVLMTGLRFLALFILLFGTLVAIYVDPNFSLADKIDFNEGGGVSSNTNGAVKLIRWSGFGLIFTTSIFSQLFQHAVPGLVRPLSFEHKKHISGIFGAALLSTGLIYILAGCACSIYFGKDIRSSVNLNFVGFTWGVAEGSPARLIVTFLAMLVVLFPALDTLSVFPLIANTLGNNLNAAFPITKNVVVKLGLSSSADKDRTKRLALTFWRLVASVPPVLCSRVFTDLSFTFQLAGIAGIFLALITPALLQRTSLLKVSQNVLAVHLNPYTSHFSAPIYTDIVLVIAAGALFVCLAQMFHINIGLD